MFDDYATPGSNRRPARVPFIARMALLVLVAAFAVAGQARATTVSGRVTEHLTGQPLGGAVVTIWYWASLAIGRTIGTPTTAADGTYSWSGECPAQLCFVTVSDERFIYAISQFLQDDTEVRADFDLMRPVVIAGEVRIDGAVPTTAVDVTISYYSEEEQSWLPPPYTNARQQPENGRYVFDRLPPGVPYRVCAGGVQIWGGVTIAQCFDHHDQTRLDVDPAYDLVTVAEGERRDDVDFALSTGGGIEGTVHDGYLGGPLADTTLSIALYGENGRRVATTSVKSDADGRYRILGLPDATYYVRANASGPFVDANQIYPGIVCEDSGCPPVTSGQPLHVSGASLISQIDFTVHPISVVRGRVTDAASGQGLGGVWVSPSRWANGRRTMDNGEFALYVPPDVEPFEVYVSAPLPYVNQVYPAIACLEYPCSETGQTFSPSSGAVVEHVDFALQTGAAISGTFYEGAAVSPSLGEVMLYDQDFNLLWSGLFLGGYATPAWLPGTYYLKATSYFDYPETPITCTFYEGKPCPQVGQDPASVAPTPITIGLGEVREGVDFQFAEEPIFRDGFEPASARTPR